MRDFAFKPRIYPFTLEKKKQIAKRITTKEGGGVERQVLVLESFLEKILVTFVFKDVMCVREKTYSQKM